MPVRLEIESLGGGGRGVARSGGKVWFVAGGLPGEVVEAEAERERAGIVEARATTIVCAGPWRDPAPCPAAAACGGCDLAHLHRAAAADGLRAVALGALRHAPPLLADGVREAPVHVSGMAWRLRARLHWDRRRGVLGFNARRSHDVVDVSPCRVLSPLLLRTIPALVEALEEAGSGDGELEWIEDLEGETGVAGWRGRGLPPAPVAGVSGWQHLVGEGWLGPGGWGESAVTMRLPVALRVPVGVFFQGNRHLLPALFATVAGMVRSGQPSRVVDLYGGVGLLAAAALHGGARDVTLVESSRPAAEAARANLPDVRVAATSAEAFLASPGRAAGTTAIVDPPRTSLSRAAVERLLAWRPERIVLLACDAAMFGRDGGRLVAAGYALESVELWDLFAGTHHVELLASFRSGP